MICPPQPPTFRLLDPLVGWDQLDVRGLIGLDDADGIRLAPASGRGELQRHDLLGWFPDRRLSPGCGPCAWYLAAESRGLLKRDACTREFTPLWPPGCGPTPQPWPGALAARGHILTAAVGDRVLIWRREGERLAAAIRLQAHALALSPWGALLAATEDSTDLYRYDLAGIFCERIVTGATGSVVAVATGRGCTTWILTEDRDGALQIWQGTRDEPGPYRQATLAELRAAVPRTTLTATSEHGFCLTEQSEDGDLQPRCFTWHGFPLASEDAGAPTPPPRVTAGQLLTRAIDSGIPRCRWHRVRIEADVLPGTGMTVAVSTTEEPTPDRPALGGPDWYGCPPGVPHLLDWQEGPPDSTDFLIRQPPGRYLYVRLRLLRDGAATPTVRRIRLDFPRVTSAELLPPIYRQDPVAEDFTERFLSLFDAAFEDLDRAIDRYPALLDPGGVPDDVLPWLGGLVGLAFDADWDAATRRKLLVKLPELYRKRGTPEGLRLALKIIFDVDAVVHELATDRNWAALNRGSRLHSARLFGRSAARFSVGGSALGRAPLRSFGNPDHDPLTAQANRIRVLLPPARDRSELDRATVRGLIERQAPAHTVADVRLGGLGLVVGTWSAVGIDTALTPLPAPVLGKDAPGGRGRAVRLGRHSVIWPGTRGRQPGIRVGIGTAAVGIHTVAD